MQFQQPLREVWDRADLVALCHHAPSDLMSRPNISNVASKAKAGFVAAASMSMR